MTTTTLETMRSPSRAAQLLCAVTVLTGWAGAASAAPEGDAAVAATAAEPSAAPREICDNGIDDDGDSVTDCGDADCHDAANCNEKGDENTEARCSDWFDNDGDGVTDCDDAECQRPNIAYCRGSWQGPIDGDGGAAPAPAAEGAVSANAAPAGQRFAPETEMADSNDGVGFVGVRFGIVAQVLQSLTFDDTDKAGTFDSALDTRVQALQLRAFGALPLLEDSFFLINLRGERSPRLTFAMFQVPIGAGHYVAFNTIGGALSSQAVMSVGKQPLLERAFYLTSAFEPGTGAAVELHGPLAVGLLRYRVFAGGGGGITTGNIGGRRFTFDNFNYTYTLGAQLQLTPLGFYNRFDSPFMYRPVPLQFAANVGAKYDQRQQERYPAVNGQVILRYGLAELYIEDYVKAELNFGAIQNAYNIMFGFLIWPEHLFFATDFGQYWTSDFGALTDATFGLVPVQAPPDTLETDLRRQRGETDWRAALHWYFWRNNGVLSARYVLRFLDPPRTGADKDRGAPITTHDAWLMAQFRF